MDTILKALKTRIEKTKSVHELKNLFHTLEETVHEKLIDPVTMEIAQPPLILCSDGFTYSQSTLKQHFRSKHHLKSPKTQEILRRKAIRNRTLEQLLKTLCAYGDEHDQIEKNGEENKDEIIIDLIDMVWKPHYTKRNKHKLRIHPPGYIYKFTVPMDTLESEEGVTLIHVCNLHGYSHLEFVTRCERNSVSGKRTILSPPPLPQFSRLFNILAKELGEYETFENPSHLGTIRIKTEQETFTLERRILQFMKNVSTQPFSKNKRQQKSMWKILMKD